MASVTKRQRKHGDVYRVQVRMKGHPQLSETFDRKSDAVRWGEDTEAALRSGGYVGEAPPNDMLFDTALSRYLVEVSRKKAAATNHLENTMATALDYFAGHTLLNITPMMVASFRDMRLEKVAPATVINNLNMLSHMYTIAVREWGVMAANPVSMIKKPKKPRGRLRFLEKPEIVRLLEESRKAHRKTLFHWISLQLQTGMRPSEGAGLTWGQVDMDRRIIDLTETKTDPRRVPMTIPVVEVLADLMPDDLDCAAFIFLPEEPKATHRRRPNQYFRESFEAAVKRAGISDFTMHDLRHTAASWMIMNGVDLRTVADILGHKNISMTMKYTHLLDDHKKDAADKIDGLLSF